MKKIIVLLLLLCPILVQAEKKFDHEIVKNVFVPKGQWFIGSTVLYSEQGADQYQFLVLTDIDAKDYTFRLSPFGGYFFADNMVTGGRFTYSRTYFNIGNVDINLGDDLSFHIKDDMYLEYSYPASGFLHIYTDPGGSKVFGFSNEVRLTYAYGQGKHSSSTDNDLTGHYRRSYTLEIGTTPGLAAFVPDFISVKVSVGVAGFSYKWADQIHNQVNEVPRHSVSGNFKIDLFPINLGMTIYF